MGKGRKRPKDQPAEKAKFTVYFGPVAKKKLLAEVAGSERKASQILEDLVLRYLNEFYVVRRGRGEVEPTPIAGKVPEPEETRSAG
jgi:hypothetical protein